ncbi:MAG: YbjQ family protein [Christensenellaceae bacterium]|jgi:uncharacterized protein YbjQ (UPF0145 family)
MLLSNIDYVPGKECEVLGLVQGNTVQAKHIGRDIMAGFKNMVGGEIESYTMLLNDARRIATERMAQSAQQMGADVVLSVRYATSQIMDGAAEVLAYGTAAKFT